MKRLSIFVFLLAAGAVANADLTLTVNGLDASMPIEVSFDNNIIIAVAGQTDEQKESYSVICEMGGKLEPLPEPNSLTENSKEGDYLITFEDEFGVGTISLIANKDMIVDDISVVAGGTIYELVLFLNPETDKVIAFGINLEQLSYIPPPEPEQEPESDQPTEISEPEPILLPIQGIEENDEKVAVNCPENTKPNKASKTIKSFDKAISGGAKDGMIDIDSDVTTNTIWTADNTYHIIADINVQALLVIEPGTMIGFAPGKSMVVNNNGAVISCGTPDNPIVYTSDSGTPGYGDYYCALRIEETASSSCKVIYSAFQFAEVGIMVINNRLDTPIKNNWFIYDVNGIIESGTKHTDILNNCCFGCYSSGIEVYLAAVPSGNADANSHILIQNNTCDYYQDYGITVHGVADNNDAGVCVLANNIVSGSCQYGLALVDDYMYATVMNTGYFDNVNNKNWAFDEDDPAFETVLPYETGTGILPVCYLRQDCNFVNTGSFFIEQTPLIGQTTDVNGIPDYNYVDIGFHYPNWNFSNPGSGDSLSADFDDSMKVDSIDFAMFANHWQQTTSSDADLDGSGFVDCNDLSIFTNQWLRLADPNIQIQVLNEENGYSVIGIDGYVDDTAEAFLFVDGRFVDRNIGFREQENFVLDTAELSDDIHELKVVSISDDGKITCSNIESYDFNSPINYRICSQVYEANEPYWFCVYSDSNVVVTAFDYHDNTLWSQEYSQANGYIPSYITSNGIEYIEFEEVSGGVVVKTVELRFNPEKVSPYIRALMVLPSRWLNWFSKRHVHNFVREVFEYRNVPLYILKGRQATSTNISWFAHNRNVEYLYFSGHGEYRADKAGSVLRTSVKLKDGICFSVKLSDYADPNTAPDWIEKLPGNHEKTGKSFAALGFGQSQNLKFAYFDCCYSGRLKIDGNGDLVIGQPGFNGILDAPLSDISWSLGILGNELYPEFFQGWYDECIARRLPPSTFGEFTIDEWTEFKQGSSLYTAIDYAIDQSVPDPQKFTDPKEHFRLKGAGDMTDLKID